MGYVWGVNFYSSLGLTVFNNFGFITFLAIMLVQYFRGKLIKSSEALAILSILFYLFMSINSVTVYALNTAFQFIAVTNRIGDVFKLSEHKSYRQIASTPKETMINITNGSYSWGFKVKKDEIADQKKSLKDRLDLEEDQTPVLAEVNLDLKYNDTLVVVGKIG